MASLPPPPNMPLQPLQADNKINRELFVGNTPPGTSELLLQHFVSAAMRRARLCDPHESPVLNARVNNKFAFVELSTTEMANKCLNLNGIPFLTAYLKISRPSKYAGPNTPTVSWQELTGQDKSSIVDPEMEKLRRELFVGNTTPESTFLASFDKFSLLQIRSDCGYAHRVYRQVHGTSGVDTGSW